MASTTVNRPTSAGTQKLMAARCRLMTREPWYGHIAMSMVWIPSQMPWLPEKHRTMGVRIVNGGEVQCLYYPKFVESLTIKELFAVIQHEIEHIVRLHCLRVGSRNPRAWNVAADMTVNGTRSNPRIGYLDSTTSELIVPLKGNIIWIPEDWQKDGTSEFYYSELMKQAGELCHICQRQKKQCGKNKSGGKSSEDDDSGEGQNGKKGKKGKKGNNGSEGQDGEGQDGAKICPGCGQKHNERYEFGGVSGESIDDHSVWNQSNVSEDEARQVVHDIVKQATDKCQGKSPGHLSEAIAALGKPIVRWRELLRQYIGRHVGNARTTYSRRSRRRDLFGIPGVSHHAASNVNVIVDTSGSIGSKELEQFFAEIDAISSRASVMVLMWDFSFQGYEKYRRGDWKKWKVNGRGGTDMAAPMKWLIDNRRVADVQIMLTDGYCSYLNSNEIAFPVITVITTAEGTTDSPGYGHVVRMKID